MRTFRLGNKPLLDLLILGILLTALYAVGLGGRPYSAPSESRYIEIGREMAETGDFVTPRLNYVKYFEKPPLFYWIQAESTRLFGYEPFTARLPTVVFAVLLCLLTYCLARFLYGRLAGVLSAFVMGTSFYLFALSRVVLLDVPLSFFLAGTLAAFLYAAAAPPGRKRCLVTYAMYVMAAGAVMTKGLIGIVLPGAVVFLWFVLSGRWNLLKEMKIVSGTVLFLTLTVPWHVLVSQRNPEFPYFYFIHEHFLRYATKEAGRYQPVWFFAAVLLVGLFPWLTFIWQAKTDALRNFWKERRSDGRSLFLVLWVGFIFLFFSLSDSKLIPYILPIFPPLAAMLGRYLALAWNEKRVPGFKSGLFLTLLLFLIMGALPFALPPLLGPENKVVVALSQAEDEIHVLSFACIIAVGLLFLTYIQGRTKHVIMILVACCAAVLPLTDQVAAHYNKDSMKMFASVINSVKEPGDEVVMYQIYYQDMPLYLSHRISIANWQGGELAFGAEHEDVSAWMLTESAFWERWMKNDHRMFVVMRREMYDILTKTKTPLEQHLYLIQEEGRNMLFLNRPPLPSQPPKGK